MGPAQPARRARAARCHRRARRGHHGLGDRPAGRAQRRSTLLHDPIAEALARRLRPGARRAGRRSGERQARPGGGRRGRGSTPAVDDLSAFSACDLVIEAAPERIELKHELYGRLAEIVSGECVLATNTSVAADHGIAATVPGPERVVGMHFFNPAPVMRLLKMIAGALSDERSLALATATGRRWARTRSARPTGRASWSTAATGRSGWRRCGLLGERIADVETIDRIMRLEGGFRMGPFELSDLVGVDTGIRDLAELLRAELRGAALASLADPGDARGGRPARPKERAWLLRLRSNGPKGYRPDDRRRCSRARRTEARELS